MCFRLFYTIFHKGKVKDCTFQHVHTTMHTNGFLFMTEQKRSENEHCWNKVKSEAGELYMIGNQCCIIIT